jgi:hypothetical protein
MAFKNFVHARLFPCNWLNEIFLNGYVLRYHKRASLSGFPDFGIVIDLRFWYPNWFVPDSGYADRQFAFPLAMNIREFDFIFEIRHRIIYRDDSHAASVQSPTAPPTSFSRRLC